MKSESVLIDGAVGSLEVLIETPDSSPQSIAVICHPHPLFEGTMHNKVVYMLARSLLQKNALTVRFNFRGVGKSVGEHADGIGEVDDVLAVLEWIKHRWPDLPVTLAGFSFGSYVALLTIQNTGVVDRFDLQRLVTVAPPVGRWDFTSIKAPEFPWLVIQGTDDELVSAEQVSLWCSGLNRPPNYHEIEKADHFFHGKLTLLRDSVLDWLDM